MDLRPNSSAVGASATATTAAFCDPTMGFRFHGFDGSGQAAALPPAAHLASGLQTALRAAGCHTSGDGETPRLVLQYVGSGGARPYRRRAQSTFVVGIAILNVAAEAALSAGYPLLVRSLSNLLILAAPRRDGAYETWFITPERGCYRIPRTGDDEAFFGRLLERMMPLAGSHLVVDNVFDTDLPRELWAGCQATRELAEAGRRLDALGVLPAPFPIHEVLPPDDLRLLQRLYSLGGLSYGNLSRRADGGRFWMSGSGVDKSNLRVVGRDFLLVKDFDDEAGAMRLSVPSGIRANRVSVDAIEHWMIYREHPEVGAVLHVHAWIDGATLTDVNFPCGSLELARTVAATIRRAPDPSRAVVGLVNHGLTITGPDLADIFDRIEGRLQTEVPAF